VQANRIERASKKKRRTPIALLVIPVAVVAIVVVLILTLSGGGAIPIVGGDDQDDAVPPFDFNVKKAVAVATVADADLAALTTSAEQVGAEITPTIDDLFTNAYLDPSNWREGDYEEVFAAFSPEALPAAQEHVETLTLGAAAGDVFEGVEPEKGTLAFDVLFDPEANPRTAVVNVHFVALGERKDGTFVKLVSDGQFFLEDLDGWTITAFDVTRNDREAKPPSPSPSASASPTAS
jgi:hypothetical protein